MIQYQNCQGKQANQATLVMAVPCVPVRCSRDSPGAARSPGDFFRNQSIIEQRQVDFTRHFGIPVEHVREQRDRPVKEIFVISNVQENGLPIGALGNDEISFHSDLSYMRKPGTISTWYAVEIPCVGGQTEWVNCYARIPSIGLPIIRECGRPA